MNIIAIKHGRSKPDREGILYPFELGCYQPEGEDSYAHLYIGNANGIGIPIKPLGGLAEGLTDASGALYNVGSGETPVYFKDGIPVACSADVTIGLTAEKAEALSTSRTFIVNLASSSAGHFDGSANVTLGVTGVLGASRGGTGRSSLPAGQVLVGNGTGAVNLKPIDVAVKAESDSLITSGAIYDYCTKGYLPLSGGVLSGVLALKADLHDANYISGGLNANDSNIFGLHGLWFKSKIDDGAGGINFYNTSTTTDTLFASEGKLKFAPNRQLGAFEDESSYEIKHAGNHDGNHVVLLGSGLDLTTTDAQTVMSEEFEKFSAFIFTARSNGTGVKDGILTLIVPRDAIKDDQATVFYLEGGSNGKYFSAKIAGDIMTLKNVGYAGGGITTDSFNVYGLR